MAVLKDLIVHGRSRFINGIDADAIHANLIDANDGVFKTITTTTLDAETITTNMLNATNARVSQTLTVDGTISTNKWEAANIANIGGNFYISPTGKSSTGTITVTKTGTTTINGVTVGVYTIVVGGTFGVTSTNSTIWGTNSKVVFTGSISYNNSKKYPLGTCNGTITNISTGTNTLTGFTITGISSAALDIFFKEVGITSISSTACNGYEMQVSVYQSYYSGALHPIGILLTSHGKEKKQYIDIYGGANALGNTTEDIDTGFAEPSVRIGQLDGLPNIVDGSTASGTKPTGWGIYTTNGFFKGKIVSNAGLIGNFTIANDLHSGTSGIGQDTNVYVSPGTISNIDIAGSLIEPYQLTQDTSPQSGKTYYQYNAQDKTYTSVTGTISGNPKELGYYESADTNRSWAFTAGNNFGVTTSGELFANGATINGVVNIKNGSNVYTIQQVEQTIYGTVAYQYVHDNITETVYKRDDNTYYWIDSNDEEHIVNEINLEHDEVTGKLITIRLEDGFNASVNQIQNAVNNNTELIQTLSDNVDGQFENINGQFISIDEQFTGQITDINQTISTQQEYINNLNGYVTITSNNIQVGNLSSNSYVLIDGTNAKVSININDNEVAYMSGNRFYAPSAVVTNLYMKTEIGGNETGDIGWVMRSNGHLSLKRLK